jgi:hypothetical protein
MTEWGWTTGNDRAAAVFIGHALSVLHRPADGFRQALNTSYDA